METWFWIWDSSPNEAIESCFSVTLNLSHKVCSNFQVYPLYFTSCLQVASLALVIMRPFRNYTPKINFECKFPNNFVWQNQFSDICYPIKNHVTTHIQTSGSMQNSYLIHPKLKFEALNAHPNTLVVFAIAATLWSGSLAVSFFTHSCSHHLKIIIWRTEDSYFSSESWT